MKFKQEKENWGFQDLMQYRIHEILLVSSPYDGFILEEEGKLTEQILTDYIGMNLSYAPRVWNASSAKKANDMIEKGTELSELNRVFQSKMHSSLISVGQNAGINYMKERSQKKNKDI